MRFATLTVAGESRAAVNDGNSWRALPAPNLSELIGTTSLDEAAAHAGVELQGTPRLPVSAPGKVICCGLNYANHIQEMGRDLPTYPTLFAKHADTLIGPTDDIELPAGLEVDWEAELAVIVGSPLRHADRETALAGIAGYSVANDVSVRDWQRRTAQWFQGKAWDGTTPLGPVIVTPDEADPFTGMEVICRVNGEEVQRDSTSTLVFDPAELLAYISTFTALRPGDVVLTGTPGGVGAAQTPARFLVDGDIVETEIPGIGSLRNTVRFHPDRPRTRRSTSGT